jgi:DDE family transposase
LAGSGKPESNPAAQQGACIANGPSVYALYRFATTKLRTQKPILDACLTRVVNALRAEIPEYGDALAIDASEIPAYANGQRFLTKNGPERERYSDPGASWGHRSAVSTRKGGSFYGWKLHLAVRARTELPVAWQVETARSHESSLADDLLCRVRELKMKPATVTLDKGYDVQQVYDACEEAGASPIIPLRKTLAVKRGDHRAPECEHGTYTFAGADAKRNATKWRCPTRDCKPASRWGQGFPAAPADPAREQAVRRSLPWRRSG